MASSARAPGASRLSSNPPAAAPRFASGRAGAGLALLLVSALYFADTLLRASLKTFWYDELVTVYLCRLPSFHETWNAVLQGADFNPPLFYWMMRAGQALAGEGLIGSRLPAILGVWVFCLCLCLFVRRRLGTPSALVAALFPVFTLAHTYAYEARPHGAVLGWCGLMLLCWQRAREGGTSRLWTAAFGLAWLGALLTHVYTVYAAVPFLAVEAVAWLRRRPLRPGILAAIAIPAAAVAPLYLQMARTYRAATSVGGLLFHPYEVLQQYLVAAIAPAAALLLVLPALLALEGTTSADEPGASAGEARALLPDEWLLAALIGCLPIIGALGVRLTHGPFFNRYFLFGIAGYAILLAGAAAASRGGGVAAKGLAAFMLLLLTADTAVALYCRQAHKDLDQVEPASHLHFPPDPRQPLSRAAALLRIRGDGAILVTDDHLFLYLWYYAPADVRARLYQGVPHGLGFQLPAYRKSASLLHLDPARFVAIDPFLAGRADVFLYTGLGEVGGHGFGEAVNSALRQGFRLRSIDQDPDHLLQHFSR